MTPMKHRFPREWLSIVGSLILATLTIWLLNSSPRDPLGGALIVGAAIYVLAGVVRVTVWAIRVQFRPDGDAKR